MNPEQLKFSKTHEWVRVETEGAAKVAVVGITAFAIEALTDLVHVELPQVGQNVQAGKPLGEVESVKAVSDVYSPVDGEVAAVNADLEGQLEHLAEDPYGAGWFVKIRIADESPLADLMDYAAYQKQCAEESAH